MASYFPGPVFGWSFLSVLFALTAAMAVIDWRTATIPKKLTLTTLGLGFIAQLLRCSLLAYYGKPLAVFESGNVMTGIIEGIAYGLVGAVIAFSIMFILWILGACGGGDVKLVAGVGAWVGAFSIGIVIVVSVVVLAAFITFRILTGQVKMKEVKQMKRAQAPLAKESTTGPKRKSDRLRTTYSLPICIATTIVMFVLFQDELKMGQAETGTTNAVTNNENK